MTGDARRRTGAVLLAAALGAGMTGGCSDAERPVHVGVLVDCVGFARGLEDATLAGAQLPFLVRGARSRGPRPVDGLTAATVAGREATLTTGCTEGGEYSTLIEQARRLVEVEHADVVIGGTWPGDGLVLRDVARRYPNTVFVVASPGPREVTLADPAPNLVRLAADYSQQGTGLGGYAFQDLGWRRALVITEDTEVGWGGAAAFLAEFCSLGGTVTQAAVTFAPSGPVPRLPAAADGAVVLASPLTVSPALLNRLTRGRADAADALLLGPALAEDADYLRSLPPRLSGVTTVVAADSPSARTRYVRDFRRTFEGISPDQALRPHVMPFRDATEAVLAALERSDGATGPALMGALSGSLAHLAAGDVLLDRNGAAVVATRLVQVTAAEQPSSIRTNRRVDQSLGGLLAPDYQPSSGQQSCRSWPAARH